MNNRQTHAVNAKHHRLAVDHELPVAVLQRGLDNPRVALDPVIAAARDQAHAVAVVFDLVEPVPVVNPMLLPVDRESDDVAARCQSGADCFLG